MADNIQQDKGLLHEKSAKVKAGVERHLGWTVRIAAVIIGILMLVLFVVVIRNLATINSQVEYVKNSPYPISVAAGHIETDLIHIRTLYQGETYQESDDDSSFLEAENASFKGVMEDLANQVRTIKDLARPGDVEVERIERLFDQLESRSQTFSSIDWRETPSPGNAENKAVYVESYIYPVIDNMLLLNNQALNSTSKNIETMYTEVNNSVSVLFSFVVIMAIIVIIMGVVLFVIVNIRGRLERELRTSLEEALEETRNANQAKSAFMANMSHDIRTPMNAIIGLTQIAIENIDDTLRVRQCLTRITTSSQHLLSLINDVLDMNKIESGKVTLSEEVFSLSYLAEEIETLFQSQSDSKKRQSEVVVENIYADLLLGDAMRIRQILLNLVSNALKYTNEGDLTRLTIKENRTSKKDVANVTFIVEDSGIGMKKEFIEHIFEPFERENNDFTIFTEGTGLGMAITKNLVDLMGGTVKVESDLGIGTKVTINIDFEIASDDSVVEHTGYSFELANEVRDIGAIIGAPTKEEPLEEKQDDAKDSEKKASSKQRLSVSGNVLIVEDNEINMEIAKQLIGSRGATIHEAADGFEAVKLINNSDEGDYDLIFMDWQMPHMNGLEATQSIRKYLDDHGRTQIPIVAMTANAFESDKQAALAAGMNDFLSKPINIRRLEEVLKEYLDQQE